MKRRSLLVGSVALAGLTAYSAQRGVRIPPLLWEPHAPTSNFELEDVRLASEGLIRTRTPAVEQAAAITLRAFTPQPSLKLASQQHRQICLTINNVATTAELEVTNSVGAEVSETSAGITRVLKVTLAQGGSLDLRWKLAVDGGYKFAAIGDSGGQKELEWCLQRAHQLGALFLLHLGDFHYTPDDYQSAISAFNSAPIPSYVSIGNHDFHDDKTVYKHFLDDIGLFNSTFTLGGVRFTNIDTASNILPYGAGQRGAHLKSLAELKPSTSNIAFTHRPLFDPQENSSHDIGSEGERDWLIKSLKDASIDTLFSGHIHIHARENINGIDNIIVGQGLGHQDLITNRDYSKMALGTVNPKGEIDYSFANLAMPWELHCHPRNDIVKESLREAPNAQRIKELEAACAIKL